MTIASEIERLQDVRTDIYDELGNKCVNLDGSSKYADVATIIKKMPVVCAKIGANKYPVVKIGNQLWTAKNLDEDLGALADNEWYCNGRTNDTCLNNYEARSKKIKDDYISCRVYDKNDGHLCYYDRLQDCAKLYGRYLRVTGTATIEKPLSVIFKILLRPISAKTDNTLEAHEYVVAQIPVGETSVDFDFTIDMGEWDKNTEGITRVDFRSTRVVGEGDDDTGLVAYTSLRVVNTKTATTNKITNYVIVPTALANEATYKKYGRLYTWDNVNTNLASLGLQGWRMPTKADFDALVALDSTGKKFRSKDWNNGTDDFGLRIERCGHISSSLVFVTNDSRLWASTQTSGTSANQCYFNAISVSSATYTKQGGLSVRLVCDLNEDGSIPDGAVIIAEADESAVDTLADDGEA